MDPSPTTPSNSKEDPSWTLAAERQDWTAAYMHVCSQLEQVRQEQIELDRRRSGLEVNLKVLKERMPL